MTDDTLDLPAAADPSRRRPAPISVTSANRPSQVSSLAALLLRMAARPRLKVVDNESGRDLLPQQQGPQ